MAIPQWRGITDKVSTTGTGSGSPRSWPAGHAAGWMATIVVHTQNQAVATPTGFTPVPNSGLAATGTAGGPLATRISAFRLIATSGSMPDFVVLNPGTNILLWFAYFTSDEDTTTPYLALTSGAATVTTPGSNTITAPGIDTTGTNDVLYVSITSHARDIGGAMFDDTAWVAGSGLANLTPRFNDGGATGSGGGLSVVTAEKATGGVIGSTTGKFTGTQANIQGHLVLAMKGAVSAATLAASDHQCGAECGAVPGVVTSPDRRHIHGTIGTPAVSQTAIARNHGRAWRFNPTNNSSAQFWNVTEAKRQLGCHIYFNVLPSADCELIRFLCNPLGSSPELRYRAATQDIVCGVGSNISTAVPVVTGHFYKVRVKGDASGATRTMAMQVDGGSTLTASKTGMTAATFSQCQWGASCEAAISGDVMFDDVKTGPDITLFPIADEQMVWVPPISDGTHSYDAANDYQINGTTDLGLAATTAYQTLLGLLDPLLSYLTAPNALTTEYLEFLLGGMPGATSVSSVEVVSVHRGPDATASQQRLNMIDGAQNLDLFNNFDFSGVDPHYHAVHFTSRIGGLGVWTQAAINGLKFRWFRGSGVPGIAGLGAEVSFVPTTAPVDPNNQIIQTHTFPAAGSYNVTLAVTDDQGAVGQITHTVTVA